MCIGNFEENIDLSHIYLAVVELVCMSNTFKPGNGEPFWHDHFANLLKNLLL